MRSRAVAGAPALALAVACAGVLAGSAWATYPGADGQLVFPAAAGCPGYSEPGDPCTGAFNALITVAPGGGPARQMARCPGEQCPISHNIYYNQQPSSKNTESGKRHAQVRHP